MNFLGLTKSENSLLMCGFNFAATLFSLIMLIITDAYFIVGLILHLVLTLFFYYHSRYMKIIEEEQRVN